MKLIRTQGRIFVAALPQESVIASMARRVLKLIREEFDALQTVRSLVLRPFQQQQQKTIRNFMFRLKYPQRMTLKPLYLCTNW